MVSSVKVDYEPCSAAVHPGQTEVAVGGGTVSRRTRWGFCELNERECGGLLH